MRVDERPVIASVPGPVTGTEYHRVLYGNLPGWRVTDLEVGSIPARGVDVHHWHWPETIPGFTSRARRLAGSAWMRACRVAAPRSRWVWTVHNLDPHTAVSGWDRWVAHSWLPHVAAAVFLSARSATAAIDRWPRIADLPRLVTRHQAYDDLGIAEVSRTSARRALGLPEHRHLVGIAGRLRADKGVASLIDTWPRDGRGTSTLVVAGRLDSDTRRAITRLRPSTSVIVRETELSDIDLRRMLRALDATVLPYTAGTNSGLALLSLSVGTPVVGLRGLWSEALADDLDVATLAVLDDLDDLVNFVASEQPLHMRARLPVSFAPAHVGSEHARFLRSIVAGPERSPLPTQRR